MSKKEVKLIEAKLPSNRVMKYNISSFDNGKDLYQTILAEAKDKLDLSSATELDDKLLLQIVMLAFSSKPIEKAIWECFDKAVIDGEKIAKETFEDEEYRQDYFAVQMIIAKANLMPFMKSLYAQFSTIFQGLMNSTHA